MLRTRFSVFPSLLFSAVVLLLVAACGQSTTTSPRISSSQWGVSDDRTTSHGTQTMQTMQGDGYMTGTHPTQTTAIPQAMGKVAILLPLSGAQSSIGQPMLQAAQQALFDMNENSFELLPFDTKGSQAGAQQAASEAVQAGAQLILGPLLAPEVEAAGRIAAARNLTVLGFTTDWSKAGGNVMTIGILPFDQGERLAHYAASANLRRVAVVAPQGAYGDAVISAFQNAARANGVQIVTNLRYDPTRDSANTVATQLANQRQSGMAFDALLMPAGGDAMTQLAAALRTNGLGANAVRWMGAGLWEDAVFLNNPAMIGAVYAAPSPELRRNFERNYQALYGQTPPRLASLAYDATALSIILMRQNGTQGGIIDRNAVMNPNGFAGIDGIFRFKSNGLAERGLAIHQITSGGRSQIIDQAPNSFLTSGLRLPSR